MNKQNLPNGHYLLTSEGEERPSLVELYDNPDLEPHPDTGQKFLGFNTSEGGHGLPLWDLREGAELHPIHLTPEKTLEGIADLLAIQGSSGNWDYDPYMHGLYNGMLLIQATLLDTEYLPRNPPDNWLTKDKQVAHNEQRVTVNSNPLLTKAFSSKQSKA